MKKNITVLSVAILILSMILSGCAKKETPLAPENDSTHTLESKQTEESNKEDDNDEEISPDEEDLENESELSQEDDEDIYDPDKEYLTFEEYSLKLLKDYSGKEALRYLEKNIQYLSIEKADEAIMKFVEHQTDSQGYYINRISDDNIQKNIDSAYNYDTGIFDSDLYKDKDTKNLIFEILDSGYKLYPDEGMYYPIIDYSVFKGFKDYVSDEMISYIDILSKDSDNPPSLDSTTSLTFDEITKRILLAEDHINNYPSGQTFSTIYDVYKMYNSFYLVTTAYTNGFDFDTKEISPELKKSYENFIANNPLSASAKLVEDYYGLLETDNFKLTDNGLNFIHNFDQKLSEKIANLQTK